MSGPDECRKCTCRQPSLYALIDGEDIAVRASHTGGPLSHLFNAQCGRCRGRYTGPWRVNIADLP